MNKPVLLIIDDEPEMVDFAAYAGEGIGYKVVASTTSQTFQKAYLTESPDLILMDVAMPDMDAVGLLGWLSDAGNQIPIILMSGYGDYTLAWANTLGTDMNMSIQHTLSKPFALEELEKVLSDSMVMIDQ